MRIVLLLLVLAAAAAPAAHAKAIRHVAGAAVEAPRSGAIVFESARPALAVLRTVVRSTGKRSSLGSTFVVDRQGRAITNYHVVAEHALHPQTYALDYRMTDGREGEARLLAIDVVHDLAVVELRGRGESTVALQAASSPTPARRGEPLFALGNPLDLGFTVTAGSYSGVVDSANVAKLHFSGALNPGMSGGPAFNARGELVGVNVARSSEGEQVAFLVPIAHAQQLYARMLQSPPLEPAQVRREITAQLTAQQQRISDAAFSKPWPANRQGRYQVPEFLAEWVDCGSQTNETLVPPPPFVMRSVMCSLRDMIYVDDELYASGLIYSSMVVRAQRLNAFQLARAVDRFAKVALPGARSRSMGRQLCKEAFVDGGGLPLRTILCVQAYRELPGLYEIELRVISQDRDSETLVSRLALAGFTWDNGMRFVSRYMESLQ